MFEQVIYVLGATCTGKSRLVESAARLSESVGIVQVGKEMRRRYPPERFQGHGSMPDTLAEVQRIFREQLQQAADAGKTIAMVDGNPRDETQIGFLHLPQARTRRICVWWVDARRSATESWLEARFADDPPSKDLARQRIVNDRKQMYPLLHRLMWLRYHVEPVLALPDLVDIAVFLNSKGIPVTKGVLP